VVQATRKVSFSQTYTCAQAYSLGGSVPNRIPNVAKLMRRVATKAEMPDHLYLQLNMENDFLSFMDQTTYVRSHPVSARRNLSDII
jgi:hypothetical protein